MRVFTILSLCVVSLTGYAQDMQHWRFGVMGGGHFSNFVNNRGQQPLPGWKYGLTSTYDFAAPLKLTAHYMITTDKASVSLQTLSPDNEWKYEWMDAGLVLSAIPVRSRIVGLTVGSGVSARYILESTVTPAFNPASRYGEMYDWTYFVIAQVGADFSLTRGQRISCLIEYQGGLRHLYNEEVMNVFESPSQPKLRSLGMTVGYSYTRRSFCRPRNLSREFK